MPASPPGRRLKDGFTAIPPMGELPGRTNAGGVEAIGRVIGRELAAVGCNWNLAPVADVLANPARTAAHRRIDDEHEQNYGELIVVRSPEASGIQLVAGPPPPGSTISALSHSLC